MSGPATGYNLLIWNNGDNWVAQVLDTEDVFQFAGQGAAQQQMVEAFAGAMKGGQQVVLDNILTFFTFPEVIPTEKAIEVATGVSQILFQDCSLMSFGPGVVEIFTAPEDAFLWTCLAEAGEALLGVLL
jgi:hypothetical protein